MKADPAKNKFYQIVRNPVTFRLFLFRKLPAAFFSGIKVVHMEDDSCSVSVPFKWFTQNPFRSIYFACLSMAAEMSTGILAMSAVYGQTRKVSMLVVGIEATFYKKAKGTTTFTCKDGIMIKNAIQEALYDDTPQTVKANSSGFVPDNELVADFWITWSFKAKK